jgi:hypothetical protein
LDGYLGLEMNFHDIRILAVIFNYFFFYFQVSFVEHKGLEKVDFVERWYLNETSNR